MAGAKLRSITVRRPRDRKQQIVAAAADLFAQNGFTAVGINDIGAAVGVSGPAIYGHFPGKDALLVDVILSTLTSIERGLGSAVVDRPLPDLLQVVRAGVTAMLDNSSGLTTSIREFERLIEAGGYAEATAIRMRIERHWREVIRSTNPDLDRTSAAIRMAAMQGPPLAVGLVRGPVAVTRPRLDELCTSSIHSILSAPQIQASSASAPSTTWRAPTNRRDEILSAAVKLFGKQGFGGVGVHEIAELIGISAPTVYHYYPSKTDILVEIFDLAQQRIATGVEHALATATSSHDALVRLCRSYAGVVFKDFALIELTHVELNALPDEERARVIRKSEALRMRWTEVLRLLRADLSEAEAMLLVAMLFPLVNMAIFTARVPYERLDDVAGVAVAHLLGAH